MSTRSRIAVMHGDVCKSVYCHYDGYPEYTGRLLLDNYGSNEANDLVSRGDVSQVKPTVGEMKFYDQVSDERNWHAAGTFDDFLDQVDGCCAEWYYVMRDGKWYVGNLYEQDARHYRQLVPLRESLAALAAVPA